MGTARTPATVPACEHCAHAQRNRNCRLPTSNNAWPTSVGSSDYSAGEGFQAESAWLLELATGFRNCVAALIGTPFPPVSVAGESARACVKKCEIALAAGESGERIEITTCGFCFISGARKHVALCFSLSRSVPFLCVCVNTSSCRCSATEEM